MPPITIFTVNYRGPTNTKTIKSQQETQKTTSGPHLSHSSTPLNRKHSGLMTTFSSRSSTTRKHPVGSALGTKQEIKIQASPITLAPMECLRSLPSFTCHSQPDDSAHEPSPSLGELACKSRCWSSLVPTNNTENHSYALPIRDRWPPFEFSINLMELKLAHHR